jgi:hypothetical protein
LDPQLRTLLRKRFKRKSIATKAVDSLFSPVTDIVKNAGPKNNADTLYVNTEEQKSMVSSIGSFISRMADSNKKETEEQIDFIDQKLSQAVAIIDHDVQVKFTNIEKKFDLFEKRLQTLEKKYNVGNRVDYNESKERFKQTRDRLYQASTALKDGATRLGIGIGSSAIKAGAAIAEIPYASAGLGALGLGGVLYWQYLKGQSKKEENKRFYEEEFKKMTPEEQNRYMMKRLKKAGFGWSNNQEAEKEESLKVQDYSLVSENIITLEAKKEFRIKAKKIIFSADSIVFDAKDVQISGQKFGQSNQKSFGRQPTQKAQQQEYQQNLPLPPTQQVPRQNYDPGEATRIQRGSPGGYPKQSGAGSFGSQYSSPQSPPFETKDPSVAIPQIEPNRVPDQAKEQGGLNKKGIFPGTSSNEGSEVPQSLEHINPNQLKFLRAMGATESSWGRGEAYSEKYSQPSNNANVRKMGEDGKDYGYFQNNAQQVKEAVEKYGMDPELAKHLHGGGAGGKSTPEQQTAAMHDYLSRKWPQLWERVKTGDPSAIQAAKEAMQGTWFGLRDSWHKPEVQSILRGRVTSGMTSKASEIEKGAGVQGSKSSPLINLNRVPGSDGKGNFDFTEIDKEFKQGNREFHFDPNEDDSKRALDYINSKGGKAIAYNKGYGDSNYSGESNNNLSSKEGLNKLTETSRQHLKDGYSAMQIDNLHKAKTVDELKSVFDAVDPRLKIVPNGNPRLLAQLLKDHPEYRDRIQYALFENASKFGKEDVEAAQLINKKVRGYNIEFGKGTQAATPDEARGLTDRYGFSGVYYYKHGEGEDGKSGGVSGRQNMEYFSGRGSEKTKEAVKFNPDVERKLSGIDVAESEEKPGSISDRFGSLINRKRDIDGYRKGQDDFNWSLSQEAQKEFGPITTRPDLTSLKTKSGKQYNVLSQFSKQTEAFVSALEDRGYQIHDIGGFSYRSKNGGAGGLSTHASGTTIDINSKANWIHTGKTDLPGNAEKLGWLYRRSWGGRFNDSMHFELMSKDLHKKRLDQLVKEGFITPDIAKYALEHGMPPLGWDKGKSENKEIPKYLEQHLKGIVERENATKGIDLKEIYKSQTGKSAILNSLFGEKDTSEYKGWLEKYNPDKVAGIRVATEPTKDQAKNDSSPALMESAKRVDTPIENADALVPKEVASNQATNNTDQNQSQQQQVVVKEESSKKMESTKHNPEKEESSPGSDGSGSGGKADAMEYDP